MKLFLYRHYSSDEGTVGIIVPLNIFILELPERDNAKQLSRIPADSYECNWKRSPKFGWCYQLDNVKDRNNILVHAGNFVGDSTLGYHTHSHGCLLPAMKLGRMDGQLAGLLSRVALQKLYEFTHKESFILEIKDA